MRNKSYIRVKENKFILGFSLVELMVVLSIISIIVGIAFPKYLGIKIRAARVEARQNLNFLYTLHQSYIAENESNVPAFTCGVSSAGTNCPSPGSPGNEIGFSVTNVSKLRYYYELSNVDGYDFGGPNSPSFIASSAAWSTPNFTGGGIGISPYRCKRGTAVGYSDLLYVNNLRQIGVTFEGAHPFKPIYLQSDWYDALKHCQ